MGDSNVSTQGAEPEDDLMTRNCDNSANTNSVSIPICFLVKEQAKSLAVIQELQKRLTNVENVQEDLIDAVIKIRNYLSDSKIYSTSNVISTPGSFNSTSNPILNASKLHEIKDPSNRTRELSERFACSENSTNEILSPTLAPPHEPDKNIELIKSKDSALESDKQDSGLDSDCRDHHDVQPFSAQKLPHILVSENNDELLQLLDEIDYRSTALQQQLATVENTELAGPTQDFSTEPVASNLQNVPITDCVKSKLENSQVPTDKLTLNSRSQTKLSQSFSGESTASQINKVPFAANQNNSNFADLFQQIDNNQSPMTKPSGFRVKKRALNGIDSTTVSSILKETNVVDLQRCALIYLVDNAVLHTRLREAEQAFASQKLVTEKMENSLKEEARILMMENRELRITLDLHRTQGSSLKSEIAMLQKVLSTLTQENEEVDWGLGEPVNLSPSSKRLLHNFSQSYSGTNTVSTPKQTRRSSLPSQLNRQSDAHIHCVKSKLLSNTSSFLDITVEDPSVQIRPTTSAFGGRILASTPMPSKSQFNYICGDSFSDVKKSLKLNRFNEKKNVSCKARFPDSNLRGHEIPSACSKTINFPRHPNENTIPFDASGKFPFNTILEKLKRNSEYKLARSGVLSNDSINDASGIVAKSINILSKESTLGVHSGETSFQGNKESIASRKKGRNIQQRIQNILDRIVAESDETA